MARKLRLEPFSVNNKLHWRIQEYKGWLIGWDDIGSTPSLETAKQILKTMKEEY